MSSLPDYVDAILALRPMQRSGNSVYGDRVLPVLSLFVGLSTFEERKAFQDSLERMLVDQDVETRRFAVDICLGFFVFRDSI